VEQFTNAARAVTNIIGNGVATVVVAKWEHEFDNRRADLILNGGPFNSATSHSAANLRES
jgi:aerobic C4-dicarboxylate transport protein